ncbi:MAG TPA: hypothetical protein VIX38_05680 [Nitrososphaeraceae archaeon]
MNTTGNLLLLMCILAVSAFTIALITFGPSIPYIAAQTGNITEGPQPLTNGTQSPAGIIPEVALKSVLEQTQGANATSFAIGNIINQTGLSNTTQSGSNNKTMSSVIEEARNTNATSFATDSIINQTQSGSNFTAN